VPRGIAIGKLTSTLLRTSFTIRFALALMLGLAVAVIIAPIAAALLAAAGLSFPFPRIFDRVVMLTLAVALLWLAHALGLTELLRSGFAEPRLHLGEGITGLAVALVAIAVLFALAVKIGGARSIHLTEVGARAVLYIAPAIVIGVLEEGFFRAFLLGGMTPDFGRGGALVVSSAVYALSHLVRSPARFYLTGFHPKAGLDDLGASAARLVHPGNLILMLFGLFLLGLVLGEAFLLTGRVYFSIGLHAGFVVGAKTWTLVAHGVTHVPRSFAGPGPLPLIAAPAGWLTALALMALLPFLLKNRRATRTNRCKTA
jgi:uncharacterized protein